MRSGRIVCTMALAVEGFFRRRRWSPMPRIVNEPAALKMVDVRYGHGSKEQALDKWLMRRYSPQ